jgi:hypothetical protein
VNASETLAARHDPSHQLYRNLRLRRALYQSVVDWIKPQLVINIGCGYECPYKGTNRTYMVDHDPAVISSYSGLKLRCLAQDMDLRYIYPVSTILVCEGLFAYLTQKQCDKIIAAASVNGNAIIFDHLHPSEYAMIDGAVHKQPEHKPTGDFDFILPNGSRIITYLNKKSWTHSNLKDAFQRKCV